MAKKLRKLTLEDYYETKSGRSAKSINYVEN